MTTRRTTARAKANTEILHVAQDEGVFFGGGGGLAGFEGVEGSSTALQLCSGFAQDGKFWGRWGKARGAS